MARRHAADEVQRAPGIGPSLAQDLHDLGVHSLASLARRDPERLYERLCSLRRERQDPCVLYAFRCAVYYSRTPRPKRHLLKWWNWKGRTLAVVALLSPTTLSACGAIWEPDCEYSPPAQPTLTTFALTPDTVNVTSGSIKVTPTMALSSTGSSGNWWWSCCGVEATSPSGRVLSLGERIPASSEPGRWSVAVTAWGSGSFAHCPVAFDATKTWAPADLSALGFDDHITVINDAWAACQASQPQLTDFWLAPDTLDVTATADTLLLRTAWTPFTPRATFTVTGGACFGNRCVTSDSLLVFRQGFPGGFYTVATLEASWVADSTYRCPLRIDPFWGLANSNGWKYTFVIVNGSQ